MSASARVELDRLADVVVVPIGAVFQRGPATVVFIVARGGIETRTVTVLRRGRDQIAIAAGVAENERVALKEPGGEAAGKCSATGSSQSACCSSRAAPCCAESGPPWRGRARRRVSSPAGCG